MPPSRLIEVTKQDISFQSARATLRGRLFLPQRQQKPLPVFVLVCGIGGRKEWFEPVFPDEICRRNLALFTFDLRGHHPSKGRMDDCIGHDLPAAIEKVKQYGQIDSTRIILGGQCLGALLCNHFAAGNQDVKGMVNISSFLPKETRGTFNRKINDAVMAQIEVSETHSADIDSNGFFEGFAKHLRVFAEAEAIAPRPVLFVHYQKDPVCPVTRVKEFFHLLGNHNKELHILNNYHSTWITEKPHASSYDDPEVAAKIGQWIEKHFH